MQPDSAWFSGGKRTRAGIFALAAVNINNIRHVCVCVYYNQYCDAAATVAAAAATSVVSQSVGGSGASTARQRQRQQAEAEAAGSSSGSSHSHRTDATRFRVKYCITTGDDNCNCKSAL